MHAAGDGETFANMKDDNKTVFEGAGVPPMAVLVSGGTFAEAKKLWAMVVEAEPELGGVMAPLVVGERYVVTGMFIGDRFVVPFKPRGETEAPLERVVLTPGKGARSGEVTLDVLDAAAVKDLATVFLVALEGLALDKRTHLGLRVDHQAGGAVTVAWSAGRLAPVGDLEVDVPPPLAAPVLTVPLRLVESCIHDVEDDPLNPGGEELVLVYELDLETLPAFEEPAQKLKCEIRMREFDLDDPAWRATAADAVRDAAERDVQEALGIFCWHTSSQIAPKATGPVVLVSGGELSPLVLERIQKFVEERKRGNFHSVLVIEGANVVIREDGVWEVKVHGQPVDPAEVTRELFGHMNTALSPLKWPLRLGSWAWALRKSKREAVVVSSLVLAFFVAVFVLWLVRG